MTEENYFLKNHLAQTTPYNMGIVVDRAEGIYIYDTAGRRYIDMISGLGVSALGHGVQEVKDAIKDQLEKYLHVMVYGEYKQTPQFKLAKTLCSLMPKSLNTCYFVNSGTEANEAALKLAKRATGRHKIMSFQGAYHGSTHGSLSVTGNEMKKYAFRPLLPGIDFIQLNNFDHLDRIDDSYAAVILETVQGDAGIRIPAKDFIVQLKARCVENGVLLILDEIQAGLGRTGRFNAFEHFGIEPDILTLGKALGAGLPIGAMISSQSLMELFISDPVLGHITTFGGHPLICAAANAGLDYLIENKLIDSVEEKGKLLHDQLISHPLIKEIRYRGLFFAIDLGDEEKVEQVVLRCKDLGLIGFWFLSCKTAFRIAPPLVITENELITASKIILEALSDVEKH